MTVLDEILATKRDEVTLLRRPAVRDLLRSQALEAPPTRDFAGALRPEDGTPRSGRGDQAALTVEGRAGARSRPGGDRGGLRQGWRRVPLRAHRRPVLRRFGRRPAPCARRLSAAGAAQGLRPRRDPGVRDARASAPTRCCSSSPRSPTTSSSPTSTSSPPVSASRCSSRLTTGAELERALSIGAQIVGVNARDLGTFDEDLGVGERLVALVPPEVIAVAESAIRSRDDAARMASTGFDAVLVGELLVKADDPTATVQRPRVARTRQALTRGSARGHRGLRSDRTQRQRRRARLRRTQPARPVVRRECRRLGPARAPRAGPRHQLHRHRSRVRDRGDRREGRARSSRSRGDLHEGLPARSRRSAARRGRAARRGASRHWRSWAPIGSTCTTFTVSATTSTPRA